MESDPEPGTPDGDRLDILATLVQAYDLIMVTLNHPQSDPADFYRELGEVFAMALK